ncbi:MULTISPECIES: FAD-binding oxidoreductase [Okeania]|uniref:FAD-binding oxidoreductase n=1 Tax=Okeania hirsuta TaxID=1458930 RepID=A0A3N6P7S5_9CYAN|nr:MULTISPECIES: FAD-binding oxidoreductase [Okeania]NET74682.1 FAD-binding oxidoreductase [Okeania sp. SIO1F9]RQH16885.1 FAD-binding oxidoreductase [Okeania hirsuta]RQH32604.1 FAD-binding oxidoreductase [Okeania hirsuta]
MVSVLQSNPSLKLKWHYLEFCQKILGHQYVITNENVIAAVETATFETSQQVRFVIQPGSPQEVQACLKAAQLFGIHIHPVSQGYNWGYGSQVPDENLSVVMNLSRLNQIKVDGKNATVTLGPGVTQQQLFEYLRSNYPHLFFSLTGSSPYSSIIGNAIDAGYANGLNVIRWNHVISLEAILPSGELLKTGFDALPNASTAGISRYGLGPDLKGLFRQSNLGIVTEMTLELSLAPAYLQIFYFSIDEEEQLGELTDQLHNLKQTGLIESNWILLHGYRILAEVSQFPWQETDAQRTLDRNLMLKLLRQQQIPGWSGVYNGVFAIYSPTLRHAEAMKADIHEVLNNKVSRLKTFTVDQSQIKKLRWNRNLEIPELTHKLLKGRLLTFAGIPVQGSIPISYWRKRNSIPEIMDLDRDRCGFIWLAVTAPASGTDALTIVPVIEHFFNDYGFEPMIVLDGVNSREMYVMTSLVYDREVAGRDEQARKCFERLAAELRTMGYYQYRWPKALSVENALPERNDDYASVFAKLQSSILGD